MTEETTASAPVVDVRGVERTFVRGGQKVHALRGVDLRVQPGTMVALHGRSGSGKTTLLNIIGGLDEPTAGTVQVCGTDLVSAGEKARISLRRDRISFVFQAFGLLPVLSAAENVEVPLRLHKVSAAARRSRVAELLDLVGLGHRGAHRPGELSGGEQQRVAIARALANTPELLIADEPTGQLDSGTGRHIMDLLRSLVDEHGLAMVVATHDPTLLEDADVALELSDGQLAAGQIGARFDGDIDRSRLLSESMTLPRPRVDDHAGFRPDEPDEAPVDPSLVRRPTPSDGEGPATPSERGVRWGPDGEVIEE